MVARYPEGCFFKTSLRSPKDAGLSGKTVKVGERNLSFFLSLFCRNHQHRGLGVRLSTLHQTKGRVLLLSLSLPPWQKIIRDALSISYHAPESPSAHVEDLAVFIRASIFSLRVTSGEDALELLFASNRSFGDLKLAELTGGDGDGKYYFQTAAGAVVLFCLFCFSFLPSVSIFYVF